MVIRIPKRLFRTHVSMAKSKFEYVKSFEEEDYCLKNTYIVVRLDGKNFHKFSDLHKFTKPNDKRSLNLLTKAASNVMEEFRDIVLAYGQSDEYSFVFRRQTEVYKRRRFKLLTNIVSMFSSSLVYHWPEFFGEVKLQYPPSFDGRIVLYPSLDNLKDYLSWRQADCHINNLYNTAFWTLVQQGRMTPHEAQTRLSGTNSSEKNELMFSEFGINYNKEEELFRKGTTLMRVLNEDTGKKLLTPMAIDMIAEKFWKQYGDIFR